MGIRQLSGWTIFLALPGKVIKVFLNILNMLLTNVPKHKT